MKKFALMLASALLVLSAASAMAAVPSKTTTDVTYVKSVETVKEDGKTEAAGWDIDVTEDEAPVIEEIAKIYDWVAAKGKSAVSYFPEETQQAISALLPEGFKLENMTMNEFVTLTLTGDVDVLNDAKAVSYTHLAESKLAIMQAICDNCGLQSEAQGIVLSLPVDNVVGLE